MPVTKKLHSQSVSVFFLVHRVLPRTCSLLQFARTLHRRKFPCYSRYIFNSLYKKTRTYTGIVNSIKKLKKAKTIPLITMPNLAKSRFSEFKPKNPSTIATAINANKMPGWIFSDTKMIKTTLNRKTTPARSEIIAYLFLDGSGLR